jgi:trimethylamine corrinoid protein
MRDDPQADAVRLERALLALDRAEVIRVLSALATDRAEERVALADRIIAPALLAIGEAWDRGEVALSQVYMAGRLVEDVLEQHAPAGPPRPGAPRIGVGVLVDRHALGKRIVCAVLGSAGYDVVDLGAGLSAEALVDRAVQQRVDILMVSVLMLNRALQVREIRQLLDDRGLDGIALVVGGAPFVHDPTLGPRVGADHTGCSAADALRFAAAHQGGAR